MSGKYEKAKENLLVFRKKNKNLGDKDFKKLLSQEIAGCDSGQVYQEFPENISIQNAGKSINKPHTEFSPFLIDSTTLLYGSLREDSLQFYNTSEGNQDKQPMRQIYTASKVDGAWLDQGIYNPINDPSMQMGNLVFSQTNGKYYFTKCQKNNLDKVICKIYSTEKIDNKWTSPLELPAPINIEGYNSTQPALIIDTVESKIPATGVNPKTRNPRATTKQKTKPTPKKAIATSDAKPVTEYLYFVSDRPEGKGGMDIWYSYYNNKKKEWAPPVNAMALNTAETECTPFFHIPSQTLYFSSDGQISAGGLDIYKTIKFERKFTKPQNLSFPINSPQDELSFILNENAQSGFLVSNRPGGTPYFHETCCDDIFSFDVLPTKPFNCTLHLNVTDADSADCRDREIQITSENLKTKEKTSETVTIKDCKLELPLKQKYQYKFYTNKKGYNNDTLSVETRDMAQTEILDKKLILRPTHIELQKELVQEKPVEGIPFVLIDVQYETNETTLNNEAQTAVDTLLLPFLQLHPKHNVTVNSHTDDHGTHKYNMNLSQARASNVVKYLISKGVSKSRLEGKGYGETKPLAPNKDANGDDNALGRSMNRRTEFLISKPKIDQAK